MRALGCADRLVLLAGRPAIADPRTQVGPLPGETVTLADIWRDMRGLADALGVPERGVLLVTRLRRRLRAISDRVGARPRRRVAVLEALDPPRASGRWLPEVIELAGGVDPCARAGGAPVDVTPDSLAEADPDAIFVAPVGLNLAGARAAVAALGPRVPWHGLRAHRERQVFLADGAACFHRPGPELAPTLEVLAEALHPEAFRFGHAGRLWERVAR